NRGKVAVGAGVGASTAAATVSGGGSARASGKARKIGRNEKCPCGSGKKYKKCHGMAA
ncbi:MAG: SEC-C domain-containing protein, partial [Chloroflexi bacterium]|nr:SEC-C domain-containing protein [Chloroflexota bacterium]